MERTPKVVSHTDAEKIGERTAVVFDFSEPAQTTLWKPINDVIMGGVSESRMEQRGDAALFTGSVSLEQGGGFASVRTVDMEVNLAGFAGLVLVVKGDRKTYKFNLTDHRSERDVLHQVRFQPMSDEWARVRVPFTDFVPTYRGRAVENRQPPDLKSLRTFGLMISDKQAGRFALHVRTIEGFTEGEEP